MKVSKKQKQARCRKPATPVFEKAVMLACLLGCCGEEARPLPRAEPERAEIRSAEGIGECLERYFESDFSSDPTFGIISRDEMGREMRKSANGMFSDMGDENSAYYAKFFRGARFSSGDLMFPNAADVVSGNVFSDENSKMLAGRRMAKSMRPTRFPNAYSLLHSMPKTSVALVDRVNRPRSGMDVRHAEDIADFFRALVGFQNRMGTKQKVCDFIPNMSREQLNELDSYYSDKIINWGNPVTGQRVCAHCKEKIKSGEFAGFGLTKFPGGMESAFCR